MARPKKNNAEYFSHDANMRNDPKIKAVRANFGNNGYAVWVLLLETLTSSDNFELTWDELNIELTAADFLVSSDMLRQIVDYMMKMQLVKIERGKLFCDRLKERLQPVITKRENAKSAYEKQAERKEALTIAYKTPAKFEEIEAKKEPPLMIEKKYNGSSEIATVLHRAMADEDYKQANRMRSESYRVEYKEENEIAYILHFSDFFAKSEAASEKTIRNEFQKAFTWLINKVNRINEKPTVSFQKPTKPETEPSGKPIQKQGEDPYDFAQRMKIYNKSKNNPTT